MREFGIGRFAAVLFIMVGVITAQACAIPGSQLSVREEKALSPVSARHLKSLRNITSTLHGRFSSPMWSPDGSKIAVSYYGDAAPQQGAWIMNADGSDPQWLWGGDDLGLTAVGWSPSGDEAFFVGKWPSPFFGPGPVTHDLFYFIGSQSHTVKQVGPDSFMWQGIRASLSPGGQEVAFSMQDWKKDQTKAQNEYVDLYTMRLDGTPPRKLTDTPDVDEIAPAWSPDGRQIAYYAGSYDTYDPLSPERGLFVMDVATGQTRKLAGGPIWEPPYDPMDGPPTWSPDGKWIAYCQYWPDPNNYQDGIFIVRSDGSGKPIRVSPDVPLTEPQWSPDGKNLLVATIIVNAMIYTCCQWTSS